MREPSRIPSQPKHRHAGGCDFAARPDLSALMQEVLWSPLADPAVVTLMPSPDFLSCVSPTTPVEFGTPRESPQGFHAIRNGGIATQLLLLPGSAASRSLTALIPLDSQTLGRVEALVRFWRSCHGRPVAPDTRMTVQQRRRLRLMMQAADGRTNGASYREIATAFYGAGRVASNPWKTSSLRDTVIGLVKGGGNLIAGGYLQLLRHRLRA
ncbi:MAG: DUF2285 domain-containing protein [Mesorhizobium sp.]|nr:DUF2285 domain-containing protein [Mesorhizobium sp. M1D.F.Ca.ET.043.01.1.1]RWA94464.1 MAG: DUF2285 domain-containing protein [Mesorhizobium sp.]